MHKKPRKKPIVHWFIKPMNAVANDSLIREFPGQEMEEVIDSNGEWHKVFRCNWDVVERFLSAAPQVLNPPKYKVFSKEGGGKTKRVKFFEPKLKRKKAGVSDEEPPVPTDPEDIF